MGRPSPDRTPDPLAAVLALGGRRRHARWVASAGLTLVAHLAAGAATAASSRDIARFARGVRRALTLASEIRVDVEPPRPPPPPPEPPPPEPEPEPEKAAPPPTAAPAAPPPEPPPPAEAASVLTADPDPDDPLDFTRDAFVVGGADRYAGGVTSSAGASKEPVREARPAAAPAPPAPRAAPAPAADLSAPAMPLSRSWDHCGFPAEADLEQVNYARVTLAVTVAPDGRARAVSVVGDPGYGFAALARRCALRERFRPARGRDGTPVATTQVLTIAFSR